MPRSIASVHLLALAVVTGCGSSQPPGRAFEERARVHTGEVDPAPNDIEFPRKYKNWPVLAVSHRLDKRYLQLVVGNAAALRAAQQGQTNPWPDGAILGHVVWKQRQDLDNPTSITTAEFLRAEFMFKDVEKYAGNGSGWGWARWNGIELEPHGSDGFEKACIKCHRKVSGRDWVHAKISQMP